MSPTLTLEQQSNAAGVAQRTLARREARLRPEFAELYPGVVPGRWEPAATLADEVVAAQLLRGKPLLRWARPLNDAHFEFRGSGRRRVGSAGPRREDR